jgi:hypothetical protein
MLLFSLFRLDIIVVVVIVVATVDCILCNGAIAI